MPAPWSLITTNVEEEPRLRTPLHSRIRANPITCGRDSDENIPTQK